MSENAFTQPQSLSAADRQTAVETTEGVASAARWFWWIAGLSLVNTVMIHSGSDTSFLVGLGFTMIADVALKSVIAAAFAIDALAIAFFFFMGRFALRGHLWAFAVGGFVYCLDALIFLFFQDFMSLGFHALALFYIVKGALALRASLKDAEALALNPPVAPAAVVTPPQLP